MANKRRLPRLEAAAASPSMTATDKAVKVRRREKQQKGSQHKLSGGKGRSR